MEEWESDECKDCAVEGRGNREGWADCYREDLGDHKGDRGGVRRSGPHDLTPNRFNILQSVTAWSYTPPVARLRKCHGFAHLIRCECWWPIQYCGTNRALRLEVPRVNVVSLRPHSGSRGSRNWQSRRVVVARQFRWCAGTKRIRKRPLSNICVATIFRCTPPNETSISTSASHSAGFVWLWEVHMTGGDEGSLKTNTKSAYPAKICLSGCL